MIKRIEYIRNLAVFKDFNWNKSFAQDGNDSFKSINILYGRNYSGKTTLSRIIRALEIGSISDKYDKPEFSVKFSDETIISNNNLSENKETIRVFNEDFVKDNLSFISNPDGDIESFAVIGDNNNKIEAEIAEIQKELGINKDGEEKTGLYKEQELKTSSCDTAKNDYESTAKKLENMLSQKATGDRNIAIRYKSDIYGDQNYNVSKLKDDIQEVLDSSYTHLTAEGKEEKHNLLKETTKDVIPEMPQIENTFSALIIQTKSLLEKQIGKSEKIEELVKDAVLNSWVKEGKKVHEEKNLRTCAFCGNPITQSRWEKLEKHFDKESTNFEKEIDSLIGRINVASVNMEQGLVINKNSFYSNYHSQIDDLIKKIAQTKINAKKAYESLISQLNLKRNNLFDVILLTDVFDYSENLSNIMETYNEIRTASNSYTSQLKQDQYNAKKELRLREVSDFVTTIKYSDIVKDIASKKTDYETKESYLTELNDTIKEKEKLIDQKKSSMNDEEKGATKVNEYLTSLFGHKYLSLRAIKNNDTDKHFRFEIIRDNKKAYNLSEGECSLVAFCYFVARLEDVLTKDKKPIIWIDDPISSLDSNHIFFVYSLIVSKIANTNSFEQLFISTHNLSFLGYLKKLNGKFLNADSPKDKAYFCINRCFDESTITGMPKYLKNHITEFNYLFSEIYNCSLYKTVDDSNYHSFYDFGNNARKFLELYLFYKFPDESEDRHKMERFFGKGKVPVILSERINNEYSHLKENISRGFSPLDVPEMQGVAKLIVETIEQKDKEQYNALVESINVSKQ